MEKSKLTVPEMLAKLDSMYVEEEQLKKDMTNMKVRYVQLQEDKECLQNIIMYTSNRNNRVINK